MVERRHVLRLKTSEGILRLYSRNVVFTETGKKNYQVIHTIDGKKIEVRITTAEIFDLF